MSHFGTPANPEKDASSLPMALIRSGELRSAASAPPPRVSACSGAYGARSPKYTYLVATVRLWSVQPSNGLALKELCDGEGGPDLPSRALEPSCDADADMIDWP